MLIEIAPGDYTHSIRPRQRGKLNLGVYCQRCGEFITLAVSQRDQTANGIGFACDGEIRMTCPHCDNITKHVVSDFVNVVLSESNERRSSSAPSSQI
jgi:ribosomal protein L44E